MEMVMSKKTSRRCVALAVLMTFSMVSVSSATVVAAQESANPWWLDRWEVAPELSDHVRIVEVRPNGRVSFEFPMSRAYGLADHGLAVIAGEDLLSFCTGELDLVKTVELVTYRSGGEFVTRTAPGGVELPTYVYESGPVDGLPWMFGVCEAWAVDGVAPPAPVYSGFTTLRMRSNPDLPFWAGDQLTGHYRNGLQGVVSDSNGNQFDLSTFVNFPLTGLEQGPPDFVRHEVTVSPVGG